MSNKIQKRSNTQGIQNSLQKGIQNGATSKIKTSKGFSNSNNTSNMKMAAKIIVKESVKAAGRASVNTAEKAINTMKDNSIGGTGADSVYKAKNIIKTGVTTVKTVKGTIKLGKRVIRHFNPKKTYSLKGTGSRVLANVRQKSTYKSKAINIKTRTSSTSNSINSQLKRSIQTKRVNKNKKSKVEEKLGEKLDTLLKSDEIGGTGTDSIYRMKRDVKKVKETAKTAKRISDLVTDRVRKNRIRSYEKIKNKRASRFSKKTMRVRPRSNNLTNRASSKVGRLAVKVIKKVASKAIANPITAILLLGGIAILTVINGAAGSMGVIPTTTVMATEDQVKDYADYIADLDQKLMDKVEKMKVGYDSYRVETLSLDGTIRSNVNEFMALIAVTEKQNFKFNDKEKALIKEVHQKLYNIETEVEVNTSTTTGEDGKETTTTTRTLVITVECLPMNYILDDYIKGDDELELFNLLAISGMSEFEDFDVTPVNPNMTQREFIEKIAVGARSGWEQYKIYPSITIAQAIIESGWGKSGLTKRANNLFGIKAIGNWKGPYVEMKTGEYGGKIKIVAKFRKYPSWEASIIDHANFLHVNKRYTNAGVFKATNYQDQIRAIHRAGYATDPKYSSTIIGIIKKYGLQAYDNGGKLPPLVAGSGGKVVNYARNFLGVPYVWAGTTPKGFDCSGFTQYVYRNSAGITLPRNSKAQANVGTLINSKASLQPGDLVFFGSPTRHVGIYVGDGKYIHSPQTGDVVKISPLTRKDFTHGRRLL